MKPLLKLVIIKAKYIFTMISMHINIRKQITLGNIIKRRVKASTIAISYN